MKEYDVVVIGAGMAGLSAATYAAADGFKVALIEQNGHPGGQVWHSPKIDNLIGKAGVHGARLAEEALEQALKFGVDYIEEKVVAVVPRITATQTASELASGFTLRAPMLLLATGCSFRKLPVVDPYAFYGRAWEVGQEYLDANVVVVGGGNAAAQSIIFLAGIAKTVHVVSRSKPTWSAYLGQQIVALENVVIHDGVVINAVVESPEEGLKGVALVGKGRPYSVYASAVFVLAGQVPNTELVENLRLQQNPLNEGRVVTGTRFRFVQDGKRIPNRKPFSMETSFPGIFAAGDIRDGAGHGVAAAMGDGNTVVNNFWKYIYHTDEDRFEALLAGSMPVPVQSPASSPA